MERIRIRVDKLQQLIAKVKEAERFHREMRVLCGISIIMSIVSLILHVI